MLRNQSTFHFNKKSKFQLRPDVTFSDLSRFWHVESLFHSEAQHGVIEYLSVYVTWYVLKFSVGERMNLFSQVTYRWKGFDNILRNMARGFLYHFKQFKIDTM